MDEGSVPEPVDPRLTDELRTCLRAIVSNPLHPDISKEHVEALIAMGLVTRWGRFLAITQAGRRVANYKE
jgi:hypothetical protein